MQTKRRRLAHVFMYINLSAAPCNSTPLPGKQLRPCLRFLPFHSQDLIVLVLFYHIGLTGG